MSEDHPSDRIANAMEGIEKALGEISQTLESINEQIAAIRMQ